MAALRQNEAIVSRFDAFRIDPRKLVIEPGYNVRDLTTPEAIAGLHALKDEIIAQGGVKTALTVRLKGDEVTVVRGHRRHAATMLAIAEGHNIVSIPAVPEDVGTNDESRVIDLVTSNSGEPLKPLEKAEVLQRLLGFGNTEAMVAKKTGWSAATIDGYKVLLSANSDVRTMIRNGELSPSSAIAAVREHGDAAGAVLATVRAAAAPKANGKNKKVSARATKKASGDETALGKKEIRSLVLGLRYIVQHFEGEAATRAASALEAAGVALK